MAVALEGVSGQHQATDVLYRQEKETVPIVQEAVCAKVTV
jgi:hypothetical protein